MKMQSTFEVKSVFNNGKCDTITLAAVHQDAAAITDKSAHDVAPMGTLAIQIDDPTLVGTITEGQKFVASFTPVE